jgi:hypothetical protein
MSSVMKATSAAQIRSIPTNVMRFFFDRRAAFDAGVSGSERGYSKFKDLRPWLFRSRRDIWGMLYGSLKVPT